jgi:two-component system OmpR family sensor kinase
MLYSEKRTLYRFLALYLFLSVVIVTFISFMYYDFEKNLMLQAQRLSLQKDANSLIHRLKELHVNFEQSDKRYPRYRLFESAIYDSDKELIYSTLKNSSPNLDDIVYTDKQRIHYIKEPESYYLGAAYVIVEVEDDGLWLKKVKRNIAIFILLSMSFFMALGYVLSKLFLKPMKDAITLLDNFIKDTTHELNTPISSIIANISMIDKNSLDDKLLKKINRIDIGAKTISNIYEDLTFLTLNHKIMSQDELIHIENIIKERIEYFDILAKAKSIEISLHVDSDFVIEIDRKKFSKVIDNIISNAIKYNKRKGKIIINIDTNFISIEDSGIGMKKDDLENIFNRYERFEDSVGGFGLGLNIVKMICDEYDIKIDIDSTLHVKTVVRLLF